MANDIEYPSLDNAMVAFHLAPENRAFLRQLEPTLAFVRIVRRSGYLRADRADDGPSLNIAPGWTNGFVSEAEVLAIFGDVDRWPSSGRRGLWGVSHPTNSIGHGGGGAGGAPDRTYGFCPKCNMALPASGACDSCEH